VDLADFAADFVNFVGDRFAVRLTARDEADFPERLDAFAARFDGFAVARLFPSSRLAIAEPNSAGERTVVIPAASSASNFAAAVPLPPATIAPAWPIRLPGGAATPAI
jgi:hypothetical protein